ncbi:hypothetical protein [Ferruginibacter sp. HRS2-29]|nr:hypothetical protein [Ferruginibacter sp. HRS2-29]
MKRFLKSVPTSEMEFETVTKNVIGFKSKWKVGTLFQKRFI